jgi:hypothetical protein
MLQGRGPLRIAALVTRSPSVGPYRGDESQVALSSVLIAVVTRSGTKPTTDRAERNNLGRLHIAGRAQHRIDEVPVAIDRAIQVAPSALDREEVSSVYQLWPKRRPLPWRRLCNASPTTASSFASHRRMHSWLTVRIRATA